MKKLFSLLTILVLSYSLKSQNIPNPYASIGKPAPKVATLTNGAYDEFFIKDSLVLINNDAISRKTGDIVFSKEEHPEIIAQLIKNEEDKFRFLSVDPIASQYPELTPYQFAGNMPIRAIDLDGLEPAIQKPDGTYSTARDGRLTRDVSIENLDQFDMEGSAPYSGTTELGIQTLQLFFEKPMSVFTGEDWEGNKLSKGDRVEAAFTVIGNLSGGKGGKGGSPKYNSKIKSVNGNSIKSQNSQHGYEIKNVTKGDRHKVGISGGKLNKDGSSRRANSQVNKLNSLGTDKYEADVKIKDVKGREKILDWEKNEVNKHYNETGKTPDGQSRPLPNSDKPKE